jgi:hypothetical protein
MSIYSFSCLLFRLIRHIKPLTLEMHRRGRVRLAERNGLAVGAHRFRVVRVVLEELEVGVAAVAVVSVEGHTTITPLQPAHGSPAVRRSDTRRALLCRLL